MSTTSDRVTSVYKEFADKRIVNHNGTNARVVSVVDYYGRIRIDIRTDYGRTESAFEQDFRQEWQVA